MRAVLSTAMAVRVPGLRVGVPGPYHERPRLKCVCGVKRSRPDLLACLICDYWQQFGRLQGAWLDLNRRDFR